MKRALRAVCVTVVAASALAAGPVAACGLEDPSSIAMRRGALNFGYPDALHVGTAIWQAQLDGLLPRDPLALRGDLTPEARGALRLLRAQGLLRQFAERLARAQAAVSQPDLAVVLVGPVLWTRYQSTPSGLVAQLHVDGPAKHDVVAVTDLAVIEAVATGALPLADALARGLLRLYGPPADVATVRVWLAAVSA
jgi:hypothetical protein